MEYQILLCIGVKNRYLLNLVVDTKTGEAHSKGYVYAPRLDLTKSTYDSQEIEYQNHLISE